MRSLNPLQLAQLDSPPGAPPPGYTMVYPRGDGTLQVHDGATLGLLPVWTATRPGGGDVLLDNRDWVDIVTIPVRAGVNQVRAVVAVSDEPGVNTRLRFVGPAADLVSLTCMQVSVIDGEVRGAVHGFIVRYEHAVGLGAGEADFRHTRIEGIVSATAPGVLRLQAQAGAYEDAHFTDGVDDVFWLSKGDGIEIDPVVGHATPGSLKITTPFDGEPWSTSTFIDAVPGIPLHFGYWAMSPTGGTVAEIYVRWLDDFFAEVAAPEIEEVTLAAGVWTHLTVDATVPPDASRCEIYLGVAGSPPEGTVLHLDEILIERPGGESMVDGASLLMVSLV